MGDMDTFISEERNRRVRQVQLGNCKLQSTVVQQLRAMAKTAGDGIQKGGCRECSVPRHDEHERKQERGTKKRLKQGWEDRWCPEKGVEHVTVVMPGLVREG